MNVSTPKRILIVEDEVDIRRGARLRLQAAGYDTIEAGDGQEGLELAVEHQPDAILMDVRMPTMDGLAALQHLGEDERIRNIPVVMLSASLVDQNAALETGARFFLSKPYQGQSLLSALQSVLAG